MSWIARSSLLAALVGSVTVGACVHVPPWHLDGGDSAEAGPPADSALDRALDGGVDRTPDTTDDVASDTSPDLPPDLPPELPPPELPPADLAPDSAADLGPDLYPPQAVPILHYTFDGNAKNSGSAGAAHDGIASSVLYLTGKRGLAVGFTGSASSSIRLPDTRDPLSGSARYTVALWFKEATVTHGPPTPYLLDFRGGSAVDEPGGGFQIYHGTQGEALHLCYSALAHPVEGCITFDYGDIGAWHHMILRYAGNHRGHGGGAPLEVFIDDIPLAVVPNPAGDVIFSAFQAEDLSLGVASEFVIDDLRIYDRTFDREEQCLLLIGGSWSSDFSCTMP